MRAAALALLLGLALAAPAHAAPALVTLEIPDNSPFAHLGLQGTRLAIAGDELDLTMPPPRS